MKTIRLSANAMVCVVNQAAYPLKRQLERQGQTFVERGGFTEKLYTARKQTSQSDPSDKSDKSDKPAVNRRSVPTDSSVARSGPFS